MNPATGTKIDYPTGNGLNGVAHDGRNIRVANCGTDNVSKINPATGTKIDYPTGAGPVDVSYDGTNIWVANVSDNTVSKIVLWN